MHSKQALALVGEQTHDFGEFLRAKDFDEDFEDSHNFSASYTSYNTDEVHDTRSYFIGYYRGPPKETEDDDAEL